MWKSIGDFLIGSSLLSVLAEFGLIAVVSTLTIYQILRMRRQTVVIISHGRLLLSTITASAICTFAYQIVLQIDPVRRWNKVGAFGAMFAALIVTRWITMIAVKLVDGGASLRDTSKSTASLFNCNWPLISRCTNQGLLYFLFLYFAMKGS